VIFGETIWDPVEVISRIGSKPLSAIALIALSLATLSTNIAANVVSPANDLSNLAPRLISFRTGGLITACIGLLMMPWRLLADPTGYVFVWLIGYSALLGPIAGIMIADYFVHRRRVLDVEQLYQEHGIYRYCGGFSLAGLGAFLLAVLPCLPGFLAHTGVVSAAAVPDFLELVYRQAWFAGFFLAFFLYLLFRRMNLS
jgi:NCS1 family nucleobase:cation symporter-1